MIHHIPSNSLMIFYYCYRVLWFYFACIFSPIRGYCSCMNFLIHFPPVLLLLSFQFCFHILMFTIIFQCSIYIWDSSVVIHHHAPADVSLCWSCFLFHYFGYSFLFVNIERSGNAANDILCLKIQMLLFPSHLSIVQRWSVPFVPKCHLFYWAWIQGLLLSLSEPVDLSLFQKCFWFWPRFLKWYIIFYW